ncbi:MAG: hypothetical protein ACTH1D_10860 [Mycobacteriaceae bacterium]|uniref:hypothetical protein n=1 Tax=Corynebacterium sp. TaxID=1720 RepID=UPI003F962C29
MTVTAQERTDSKRSRRRSIGQAVRVPTLFLGVFAVAGLLWGWWRPVVTAVVTDTGGAEVDPSSSTAAFQSFAVYAVATAVLGALLAGWAYWRIPALRGPLMLLGVVVMAVVGSAVFLLFGNWFADFLHDSDLSGELSPGQEITIVSRITGAAGYLAAPAAAAVVYWTCALFSPDEAFSRK